MSLPNDITATDATTNTSSFWNDLVENAEAIFDGSAFDDESVTTKYGTVALYLELDSVNTSDSVTLDVSTPYLVIIKDEPGLGLDTELGLFTNGSEKIGITEGNYGNSYEKIVAGVITPTNGSFTASVQNGGPSGDTVTKFLIIKLDNNADLWNIDPEVPYPGLIFTSNELLTGQKVNKVIMNVNAEQVETQSVDSTVVDIVNNTKNSMSVIGSLTLDEIIAPAYEASEVVAELPITIEENLEDSLILISGVAETKTVVSELVYPDAIRIYDGSENLVAEQEGSPRLDWFSLWVEPLEAGSYTIRLSYTNDSLNVSEDQEVPAVVNISVLGFGV